jgi:hypothetical protein
MDAWLKTHEAWISPLANAIYAAGGDTHALDRGRNARGPVKSAGPVDPPNIAVAIAARPMQGFRVLPENLLVTAALRRPV